MNTKAEAWGKNLPTPNTLIIIIIKKSNGARPGSKAFWKGSCSSASLGLGPC